MAYDAVFPDILTWAAARRAAGLDLFDSPQPTEVPYSSSAKQAVIPFAPLTREIGVSPVEDTEVLEMTLDRQQQVSNWVGLVKSPFDLIQRAEGFEGPNLVFYGGQNRAVKNIEDAIKKATVRSSAGRASIRREYDTTMEHFKIAKYRVENATQAMQRLRDSEGFRREDVVVATEILQELANGLAANLDEKFTGGDEAARVMGNSILAVAAGIEEGTIDPMNQKRLLYAGVGYVRKQQILWDKKLTLIYNFAAEHGFSVGRSQEQSD